MVVRSTCQCTHAGFCPTFVREVSTKEHARCQRPGERGAKLRHQWAKEAGLLAPTVTLVQKLDDEPIQRPPSPQKPQVRRITLDNSLCSGDCVVATMAIESFASEYRGRFKLAVNAHNNQRIFENNPHLTQLDRKDSEFHRWTYTSWIGESTRRPIHFGEAYTQSLGKILGVNLTLNTNRPHLYLSAEEMSRPRLIDGDYWVMVTTSKNDFQTKRWLPEHWQRVVDLLPDVRFASVGLSKHNYVPVSGVIDLVDKTSLRELMLLVYHSKGGVGPSTFLQHLCAAFEKPYVLVDSAREPASWMTYPLQTSLIKHGTLACCSSGACWRTKLSGTSSLCSQVDDSGSVPVSRCIIMINPEQVVEAIQSYATR